VKGKIPNKGRAQSERCTTAKDAAVPKNFLKVHPKNKSQFSPETEIAMMIAQNILQFNKPISAEKFQCKKNRRENFSGKKSSRKFQRKKIVAEFQCKKFGCKISAEKNCRENFCGKKIVAKFQRKNLVVKIQRKKNVAEFLRKKFGCKISAEKIKIILKDFRGTDRILPWADDAPSLSVQCELRYRKFRECGGGFRLQPVR
jgi:hypothetical protein